MEGEWSTLRPPTLPQLTSLFKRRRCTSVKREKRRQRRWRLSGALHDCLIIFEGQDQCNKPVQANMHTQKQKQGIPILVDDGAKTRSVRLCLVDSIESYAAAAGSPC